MKKMLNLSVIVGCVLVMVLGSGCCSMIKSGSDDASWQDKTGSHVRHRSWDLTTDPGESAKIVGSTVGGLFNGMFGGLFSWNVPDNEYYGCPVVVPATPVQPQTWVQPTPAPSPIPAPTPSAPAPQTCTPVPDQNSDSDDVVPGSEPPPVCPAPTSYAAPVTTQTLYAYNAPVVAPTWSWLYVQPNSCYDGYYYRQGGWLKINVNLGGGGGYRPAGYSHYVQPYRPSYYSSGPVGHYGGWGGGDGYGQHYGGGGASASAWSGSGFGGGGHGGHYR